MTDKHAMTDEELRAAHAEAQRVFNQKMVDAGRGRASVEDAVAAFRAGGELTVEMQCRELRRKLAAELAKFQVRQRHEIARQAGRN